MIITEVRIIGCACWLVSRVNALSLMLFVVTREWPIIIIIINVLSLIMTLTNLQGECLLWQVQRHSGLVQGLYIIFFFSFWVIITRFRETYIDDYFHSVFISNLLYGTFGRPYRQVTLLLLPPLPLFQYQVSSTQYCSSGRKSCTTLQKWECCTALYCSSVHAYCNGPQKWVWILYCIVLYCTALQ